MMVSASGSEEIFSSIDDSATSERFKFDG